VHLGQDDLPPERARILLGRTRILGYSTHSLEQAVAANFAAVDYLAIGPVFQTATKDKADPVVGIETVSAVRAAMLRPLVAIGGITIDRARSVIEAGADSVAVIADLFSTGDIKRRTREFLSLL